MNLIWNENGIRGLTSNSFVILEILRRKKWTLKLHASNCFRVFRSIFNLRATLAEHHPALPPRKICWFLDEIFPNDNSWKTATSNEPKLNFLPRSRRDNWWALLNFLSHSSLRLMLLFTHRKRKHEKSLKRIFFKAEKRKI